jgi:hypothetical protein
VELYRMEKERERKRKAEVERLLRAGQGQGRETDPGIPPVDIEARAKETIDKARQKREEIAKKKPEYRSQVRAPLASPALARDGGACPWASCKTRVPSCRRDWRSRRRSCTT